MKQTLIGIIACVVIATVYLNLPMEWRRHKDIQLGEEIAINIEAFRQKNQTLPNENNDADLASLGLRQDPQVGWQPNYRRLDEQHYELVYRNGFKPPYLAWNSRDKKWTMINE